MSLVKTKVSTVVSKQAPQFVREDHERFLSFLEAYYEWLEEEYKTRELENIRDIDDTLDRFITNFRNEVLNQIPEYVLSDKRYLAKVIQDLYRSKGTVKSYEFLFRVLFDETPQLYFPKVDMLRVSDGKFSQKSILRVSAVSGDPLELLAKTIVQYNEDGEIISEARVENVIAALVGSERIYTLTLNESSVIGTIQVGVNLETKELPKIICVPRNGVVGFTPVSGGSYYQIGDPVSVISGSGVGAVCEVADINVNGSVTGIIIDSPGSGYSVGQELIFNNSNAGGASSNSLVSARAIISSVGLNGEITGIKILSGGNFYTRLPRVSAPTLPPVTPPLTNGGAQLLAISDNIGKITKLNVPTFGLDYENPPNGIAPAYLVLKGVNPSQEFSIGEIVRSAPQSISLEQSEDELLLEDGSSILLEGQQNAEGVLISSDLDRNIYKLYPVTDRFGLGVDGVLLQNNTIDSSEGTILTEDGNPFVTEESAEFLTNMTVEGWGAQGLAKSGSFGKVVSVNQAELKGQIGTVGKTLGSFLNADGKISESSKKIQDSFFYQEFSYVIKVGQSIDKYKNVVRKLLHPVGLALFGEVQIQTAANSKSNLYGVTDVRPRVERFKYVLSQLISLKTRALGSYRTEFEETPSAQKQQVTLFLEDFVATILTLRVSQAEFLPSINFPNLTPTEVHLLDLRVEPNESYKSIVLQNKLETKAEYIASYYEKELEVNPDRTDESIKFGNRLSWLEKWKFAIPPYEAGDKNTIGVYTDAWNQTYPGLPNQNYWSIGSTQIKDFANISVADIINSPNKRVNYAFESFIDVVALPRGGITFDSLGAGHTFDNDLAYRMDADSIEMDTTSYSMDSTFFRVKFDNLT
jgi:hypothetical protein